MVNEGSVRLIFRVDREPLSKQIVAIVQAMNIALDVHAMNALTTPQVEGRGMDRLVETEHENERIVLGLLSSVETDGARSQRRIAAELGIALGLVNAYLKRCVKKGLVKVHDAPARRYAYYLTPQGFAEKSRLTVQYLSDSFSFFRKAKDDCTRVFEEAAALWLQATGSGRKVRSRRNRHSLRGRGRRDRGRDCRRQKRRQPLRRRGGCWFLFRREGRL